MPETPTVRVDSVQPSIQMMVHNYPYTTIERSHFRLLHLQPASSSDDPLEARLSICERDASVEYEAVSYTWGKDTGTQETLKMLPTPGETLPEHCQFSIRPSLAAALKRFRGAREERVLWTDAICIDQNILAEKSQQVPMMESVYSRASRVLVWLGPATKESTIAFDFMKTIVNIEDFDELVDRDANTAPHWAALHSVMRWNWFTRRWIIQEIALAKEAVVWCGDNSISWTDFCHVVDLFKLYYEDIKETFLVPQFKYARNTLGEVEALGACQLVDITNNLFRKSNDGKVERRLITLESLVSRLTMFDAGNPADTVYALVAICKDIKTDAQAGKSVHHDATPVQTPQSDRFEGFESDAELEDIELQDLTEKLRPGVERFRKAVANLQVPSLPKQKKRKISETLPDVVGKMMLTHPSFRVDYTQEFLKICIDFVEFAIMRSSSLDVILRPWVPKGLKEKHKLPSWLISVDIYPFQRGDGGAFSRANGDPFVGMNASDAKPYSACSPNAPALALPIKRHGNVTPENGWGFCCKARKSMWRCNNNLHRSLFVTGFVFDKIGDIKDPAVDGTIPGDWFSFGKWDWENPLELPPDDLWRTLVADRETDGSRVGIHYRKTLHTIMRKRCSANGALNLRSIMEVRRHDRRTERVLNRIFAITPNRRLFRTTGTTRDLLGLAPYNARKDDRVCILYGCSVPVILRKHEETMKHRVCHYWELIGDAYVHGLMEGHAVEENERSTSLLKSQQFELK